LALDGLGCDGQSLGDAASGIEQRQAQGPQLALVCSADTRTRSMSSPRASRFVNG
jgi:hypothetical protein